MNNKDYEKIINSMFLRGYYLWNKTIYKKN